MSTGTSLRRFLAILTLVAGLVAGALPANAPVAMAGTRTTSEDLQWYWSPGTVRYTLIRQGLAWSDVHDLFYQVRCTGLGDGVVSSGTAMYADHYCRLWPIEGGRYDVLVHATGQHTFRFEWAGWRHRQRWWWSTQSAADSLVQNGLQWSDGYDPVVASSCARFGPSSVIDGYRYYRLFYCTVTPATGYSYSVVLHARGQTTRRVDFVSYTLSLPVTPAGAAPVPATGTSTTQQLNEIIARNQNDQLFLSTVQSSYLSTSASIYGSAGGMFGGSACTWPAC